MSHSRAWSKLAIGLCLPSGLLGSPRAALADEYRYHRDLTVDAGWARVTLPNDVLQACRPDLGDLRIVAQGSEIPYALEEALAPSSSVIEFSNVEMQPGHDTVAVLDRGQHPDACDSLELTVNEDAPFLKPVTLESSNDGVTYGQIAKGSVFSANGAKSLSIGFASNDRRYLRLRFDDRFGASIRPVSAKIHLVRAQTPLEHYPLPVERTTGADTSFDTYALALPAANLRLAWLALESDESAFARNVRVQELVLFRDELSRRLISDGRWLRSPNNNDVTGVKVNATVGRRLEIEVERMTNQQALKQVVAWVYPRVLLFNAPGAHRMQLEYGSQTVPSPRYDVGAALTAGMPTRWNTATLGTSVEDAAQGATGSLPRRGQPIDVNDWERRQALVLPREGSLAYLDLSGAVLRHLPSFRIVNPTNAQVPYVVESDARHVFAPLEYRVIEKDGHTRLLVSGLHPEDQVEALGLTATAPAYFERAIEVTETDPNARKGQARRSLGRAIWKRTAGASVSEFLIRIESPRMPELEVDIDNGDDAAVTLTAVSAQLPVRRIDFEYSPGEQLTAYWRNPNASPPRYDLTMIAGQLLSSPASRAQLGVLERTQADTPTTPKWFWWVAVIAGLVVAAVLARVIMGSSSNEERA